MLEGIVSLLRPLAKSINRYQNVLYSRARTGLERHIAVGNCVTPLALSKIDKSISKHFIFGRTKRTRARRCYPRDIRRVPMFIRMYWYLFAIFVNPFPIIHHRCTSGIQAWCRFTRYCCSVATH